ncbi:MAG: rod-binding protein [Lachnospiraceae bacterium]
MAIGDVTNIAAMTDYVTKAASDSKVNTSAIRNKDYSNATEEELMDVCKEFEAYFLEQCFKEMWKSVPTSEMTSTSTSTMMDYYKDEMIRQVSSDATEQNSLGLAQMLFEQMKRNYDL